MPLTNQTLFDIRGRVRQFRKGIDESQIDNFLNDRIRQAINYRTYWSSLIVKGTLQIPNAYTTGTVSVTTGSPIVTGVGCNFPVNDVVNSTIPTGIVEYGYQDVYPASMNGITYTSILLVDGPLGYGMGAEAVPVVGIVSNNQGFDGQFKLTHNPNCPITQSSLAGQQFRMGQQTPIFTVLAVLDSEHLLLDQPWGNAPQTGQAYQIYQVYYNFGPNLQELFWVLDQQQGLQLELHTPVRVANWCDPQRTNAGPPSNIVDAQPSPNGIIQFEVWPQQNTAYTLQYAAYQNWPPLINDTDIPPFFFNPALWYWGAVADALRFKNGPNDPYHNPKLADVYEAKFNAELQQQSNADEAKVLRELSLGSRSIMWPGGASWDQQHDIDVWYGQF